MFLIRVIEENMSLNRFNVAVIGAGALGCAVLSGLSRLGFASVRIVDGDIVQKRNLGNQPVFSDTDVEMGAFKADAAVKYFNSLSVSTAFISFPFYVGDKRIHGVIEDTDLVIDLTDNLETRLVVNDACLKEKVPMLASSIRGKDGFFYLVDGRKACFNCISTNLSGNSASADCASISREDAESLAKPVVRHIISFFDGNVDTRFFSVDLKTGSMAGVAINKDPSCDVCGSNKRAHTLKSGFIQMCGDGLKISLQRDVDLSFLESKLTGFSVRRGDRDIIATNGDKQLLVSGFGDILFTGFSRQEAEKLISHVFS